MNVLSLFDGMSCGHIALDRAGITVKKYYASEIDKHAMKVSQANYPDTIRLGDITKWRDWNIEQPDIIIGGSPCQGFSLAGKQLNFDDERSKLFFVFADILQHYNPKYFLLENVRMKKEYEDVITNIMGIEPIMINSNLLSAQNRERLYWTNINCNTHNLFNIQQCGIEQPEDKEIFIKDILESNVEEKYYLSDEWLDKFNAMDINGKNNTLTAGNTHKKSDKFNNEYIRIADYRYDEGYRIRSNNKSPTLATCGHPVIIHNLQPRNGKGIGGKGHLQKDDGKSYCVDTGNAQAIEYSQRIRRLTPIECERLQTVPDNYTNHVSDSQRYRMLGNGWTVDVIAHILGYLK